MITTRMDLSPMMSSRPLLGIFHSLIHSVSWMLISKCKSLWNWELFPNPILSMVNFWGIVLIQKNYLFIIFWGIVLIQKKLFIHHFLYWYVYKRWRFVLNFSMSNQGVEPISIRHEVMFSVWYHWAKFIVDSQIFNINTLTLLHSAQK